MKNYTVINTKLTDEDKKELKLHCLKNNTSMSEFSTKAILEKMRSEKSGYNDKKITVNFELKDSTTGENLEPDKMSSLFLKALSDKFLEDYKEKFKLENEIIEGSDDEPEFLEEDYLHNM